MLIGNRENFSLLQARRDGCEPCSIPRAVEAGQVVFPLVPNGLMLGLYKETVVPYLEPGAAGRPAAASARWWNT